ncbi:hypothetical protein [Hydrogenophaga laconesensis]|uniref:Uncharacterized protein n=1 Tax=Hydrogenophaga laconesensis TaxID=1805971 RepID=A0ABU1V9V1_9BURK|nr:hypothetical protein [Hydrogenophaga laconesensis]MDR7094246.1 hypothetical protein [Hydrogenophaga laconesensis]
MRKQKADERSPLEGWIDTSAVRAKPSLTEFDLSGGSGDFSNVR